MTRGFSAGMAQAVRDIQDQSKADENEKRLVEIRHLAALARKEIHEAQTLATSKLKFSRYKG